MGYLDEKCKMIVDVDYCNNPNDKKCQIVLNIYF